MSLAPINVTQPHTLGVEEAIARLTKGEVKPSMLKLTEVTANFVVEVMGVKVAGRAVIAADHVTVTTDPVLKVAEWVAENRIKAKLAELLK